MKRRTYPAQKSGKAPYSKYGKRPFIYSPEYYRWKSRAMGISEGQARLSSKRG